MIASAAAIAPWIAQVANDVRRVEQFRRFEELARVDETLARLLDVARLASALGPTHR